VGGAKCLHSCLLGTESAGVTFTEGENKSEIKSQIRVVLSPAPPVLSTVKKKNLFKREKRKEKKKRRAKKTSEPRNQ